MDRNPLESNKDLSGDPVADPPPAPYQPDSLAESTRKSGLAWSAGIVLFGSILLMLLLGWFADTMLGSSPWGIVGGIIIGGLLGFIQFFRLTSQIFRK